MFKKLAKICLAGLLYHLRTGSIINSLRGEKRPSPSCIILMYHRVMPTDSSSSGPAAWMRFRSLPGIVVSPEMFYRQVEFLRRNYTIIGLEYLVRSLRAGTEMPDRSVVITFDDGWRDNYLYAFPILRELKIPATVFLSTGFIGTARLFWPEMLIYALSHHKREGTEKLAQWEHLLSEKGRILLRKILKGGKRGIEPMLHGFIEELKSYPPHRREKITEVLRQGISFDFNEGADRRVMMNWEEVREMAEAGIQFGSHGVEHDILTLLSREDQVRELSESKRQVEDNTVAAVPAFAYPNGNYNEAIKKQVRDAGYCCAVGTEAGRVARESDLFELKRINVHDEVSRGWGRRFSKSLFAYHIDLRFQ